MASIPNITLIVFLYAYFQVSPRDSHIHTIKHIFRYLKGITDMDLWYSRMDNFGMTSYLNFDFVGFIVNKKKIIAHVNS